MYILKAKKLVAPAVLDADGVKGASLIEIRDDGSAVVTPFERETANTVFHPGPVAVVSPDAVTEFLLDDLEMAASLPVSGRIVRADSLLRPSGLYATPHSPAILLAL